MKKIKFLETYRDKNKTGLIRLLNHNSDLYKEISESFNVSENMVENLYCYFNNIESIPKCPYCGKNLKFATYTKGYIDTCGDKECISKNKSKTNIGRITTRREFKTNIEYTREELEKEFDFFKNTQGDYSYQGNRYKIIKHFQQEIFYKKEKEFLEDESNYQKIVDTFKLKNQKDPTESDIIINTKYKRGVKRYSHFQPLWIKWFCETNNVEKLFDPCGGWGHRMLGCINLKKYIYNDPNKKVTKNVKRISEYFNMKNTEFHSFDFRKFEINLLDKDIDAWFTCPPYVDIKGNNLEHYKNKDFTPKKYQKFINHLITSWFNYEYSKTFGIVIREDIFDYYFKSILEKLNLNYTSEIVGKTETMFHKEKIYKEKIYTIKK